MKTQARSYEFDTIHKAILFSDALEATTRGPYGRSVRMIRDGRMVTVEVDSDEPNLFLWGAAVGLATGLRMATAVVVAETPGDES